MLMVKVSNMIKISEYFNIVNSYQKEKNCLTINHKRAPFLIYLK